MAKPMEVIILKNADGVVANSPLRYRIFMDREFFDHIDIDKQSTY